jgi:hypothetical protein
VKSRPELAEDMCMVLLIQAAITVAYLTVVGRAWMLARRRRKQGFEALLVGRHVADLPPAAAVGWPPEGTLFNAYVEEGLDAMGAYLSEGAA